MNDSTLDSVATWLVHLVSAYGAFGVLFSLAFVSVGLPTMDPAARNASFWLRLILAPGSVALWPWLLQRWLRKAPAPMENNAHRRAAVSAGDSAADSSSPQNNTP